MFLKSNNRPTSKIETIVGVSTEIEGNIRTNQSLRIDGKVKGEVCAESVFLGEMGVVLGDISAQSVTIGGKVKGNIEASVTLELLPKGQVLGDIRTSKLIVADGATFEGNSQMIKAEGQIVELNPQMLSEGDNGNGQKALKVVSGGKRS